MDNIPNEIMCKILNDFTLIELIKLKCVCKNFYFFIDEFINITYVVKPVNQNDPFIDIYPEIATIDNYIIAGGLAVSSYLNTYFYENEKYSDLDLFFIISQKLNL